MAGAVPRAGLSTAIAVALADQATKWAMLLWLQGIGHKLTVTPFFDLVLVYNRGASFGLFDTDSPWGRWLLSGFAMVIVAGLLVWMTRTRERPLAFALGLIAGGAAGNLVDRVLLGHVVDFLDFHIGGYHWPAFNLADSAITVGVAIVLYGSLIGKRTDRTVSDPTGE